MERNSLVEVWDNYFLVVNDITIKEYCEIVMGVANEIVMVVIDEIVLEYQEVVRCSDWGQIVEVDQQEVELGMKMVWQHMWCDRLIESMQEKLEWVPIRNFFVRELSYSSKVEDELKFVMIDFRYFKELYYEIA